MFKKILLVVTLSVLTQMAFAADEVVKCKEDKDCKAKDTVCILALTPPQCKPKQEKGKPCKRNAVCISNKCTGTMEKAGVCE